MLNISKSSGYIPNLIISSFDFIYDQFQLITENFNFYLKKYISYNFHIYIFYMINIFLPKIGK